MTTVSVSGNVVYIDGKPHEIEDRVGNMIVCKDRTVVTVSIRENEKRTIKMSARRAELEKAEQS